MIYKMDIKEIRKLLLDFSSTIYGRTMFLLCYSVFFIIFASLVAAFIIHINNNSIFTGLFVIISAFMSVISFIIGSLVYYKELRLYAENR